MKKNIAKASAFTAQVVNEIKVAEAPKADISEMSLNDFVFNLAPTHSNDELFILLEMDGRQYSEKSVRWYASKARAGVRR